MKNIFLLPVIVCFGFFFLISCTKTTDQATTIGKNSDASKEVSANQTFSIEELVDRATANKDNWQGKEVTVSGYVSYMPSSDGANGYVVSMSSKHNSDQSQWQLTCKVPQGDLPEGIISKTIEVRGKIGSVHRQSYLNLKSVTLDPCEIKK